MEVAEPIVSLLKDVRGVSHVIVRGSPLPTFDYHCPLLSLPLAFKTNLNSIPCSTKYVHADPVKLTHWTSRLGEKRHPRIGLVWSGRTEHKNDHNRSIALAALIPHLPTDYQYVSLQKEVREIDKPVLESSTNILHFGDELHDFTDTAALCELMDVVISVDTSVAHLSGALGQPTWVLLSFNPDWRWLLERDDSPWYPSIKLYRQSRVGDWNSVLVKLTADLAQPKHAAPPAATQTQATFQQALALHQNGQWVQAQTLYQEILKTQPEHADALHLSGVIALQTHDYQTALHLIDRAIQIRPDATCYSNRGAALQGLTQLEAAVASYDRAIALRPDCAEAYSNRGNAVRAFTPVAEACAS